MMMLNSEGLAVIVVLVYDTETLGTAGAALVAAYKPASTAAGDPPLPVTVCIKSEIGFPRNAPAILLLPSPSKP